MAESTPNIYHRSRILDSAIDYAIFSMDLSGHITSWNDGARRILGWTEAEACGRLGEMIFTPEDREMGVPEREIGTALKCGRSMDERWHLRRDGTRFRASGEMLILADDSGQTIGLMKVMRDRTERWLQDQRHLAILELGNELSNLSNWREIASTAAQSVGKSIGASLTVYSSHRAGQSVIEGGWCDTQLNMPVSAVCLPHLERALGDGRPFAISDTGDQPVAFGDGIEARAYVHVPLLEGGVLTAVFSAISVSPREWTAQEINFLRDVAGRTHAALERRRAESALAQLASDLERQVEQRLAERNRLWFSTSDLMATVGAGLNLQELNPAWARLLGWAPEALLGRSLFELTLDEGERQQLRGAAALLMEQAPVHSFVCRLSAQDGTSRVVNFSMSPDGERSYLVGRDITVQVDTEERLRQSQKMDALGQLTGGIAHDFNNLLTGIIGSLDLLRLRLNSNRLEGLDRFMTAAQTAAQRAAALTHRLLSFARNQPLDPRSVDVKKLIKDMEELLRRTLHEGIRLRVAVNTIQWAALTDAHQLENAILNLVINSRDALPRGGEIAITAEDCNLTDDGGVGASLAGEFVCISVADTGTGMPQEVMVKVFEPFFTTKPSGQGTGLGLAMTYGFAKQSGGDIRISSELGVGTTVKLFLPRAPASATENRADQAGDPERERGRGESIFVIEDDPTVRLLLSEALDELGYRRIEAPDGETAIPILRSSLAIDLVIIDCGLPYMDGRQVAVVAREHRPEAKVLFITGYADAELLAEAETEPNTWVLIKPVTLGTLSAKLHDALGRRR
jgi:PAS domain S-box-containing protein